MIALDTNILVHAHRRDASLHERAFATVRDLAESDGRWGICYHSLVEFYAIVTHHRLWARPSSPDQAIDQIEVWRGSPGLRILFDSESCVGELEKLASEGRVTGGLIHDARIVACCLDHGVGELWTVDRDFSRFPRVKTRNPLH
ncbi:MAG: PIN domain-containing protein [Puniceicoccaceae bacterium]|nr:MAG: PIN domain-containing protein [Puniceicoccaceae bacterium]